MPPSEAAINAAWAVLMAMGIKTPPIWDVPEPQRTLVKRQAMRGWQAALASLDDAGLSRAVERYIATTTSDFWPAAPAKLLESGGRDNADVAWEEVLAEFDRRGVANRPRMTDDAAAPPARRIQNRNAKIAARFPDIAAKYKPPAEELNARIPERPTGEVWYLDSNPLRRRAKEAGLRAAGGWAALDRLDDRVANRASFRSAFSAVYAAEIEAARSGIAIESRGRPTAQVEGPTDSTAREVLGTIRKLQQERP
jgi:hypothetical protein